MRQCNCSLKQLLDVPQIEIICFGAGNYLKAFLDECSCMEREPNIIAIGDNNHDLRKLEICHRTIEVIRAEKIASKIGENTLLLITTAYYNEIWNQLNKIEDLKYVDCYIYPLMQIYAEKLEDEITIQNEKPLIPKKIHYCWFGGKEIPAADKHYIENWRRICPDYEIIEWNESNYDIKRNPYTKAAYESENYAFVSDYARIEVLYQYGGFYFDTDVELLKNIEPLRCHNGFIGTEAAGGAASGLGCGFKPQHSFLRELMEQYNKAKYIDNDGIFVKKVNALFETDLLRCYGYRKCNKIQVVNEVVIYPFEYFSPLIVGTNICRITKDTYSVHHYHYSWRKMKEGGRYEDIS